MFPHSAQNLKSDVMKNLQMNDYGYQLILLTYITL